MKRILAAVVLIFACLSIMVGCQSSQNDYEEEEPVKYELSTRQISLLKELGLPTDYEELNSTQKNAIVSIEKMLIHLEETYGKSFSYLGYVPYSPAEQEHLIAYPSDGSPENAVTLYRISEDGEFRFEDNYKEVLAKPVYENAVSEFVGQYIDLAAVRVFSKVYHAEENCDEDEILKSANATSYVFISGDACTRQQYDTVVEAGKQLLQDNFHGEPTNIIFLLTRAEEMYAITEQTYYDMLTEDIFIADADCSISATGDVKVY